MGWEVGRVCIIYFPLQVAEKNKCTPYVDGWNCFLFFSIRESGVLQVVGVRNAAFVEPAHLGKCRFRRFRPVKKGTSTGQGGLVKTDRGPRFPVR